MAGLCYGTGEDQHLLFLIEVYNGVHPPFQWGKTLDEISANDWTSTIQKMDESKRTKKNKKQK